MIKTLEKRQLGADLSVSQIGLGCMGMSEFYGEADREESLNTLHTASDLGVTLFDTADMYGSGANEELLGQFIRQRGRANIQIATKFGIVRDRFDYAPRDHSGVSNDPTYARRACEASLQRLGVDHIDLYYVHRIEPSRPIEDVMGALSDLVREGKIGHIGLSEVSASTLEAAHAIHPVAAVQSEYSLWSRDPETDILDKCEKLGIGFVAYSPLGRGFLTGALKLTELSKDDWRLTNPRFSEHAATANQALATAIGDLAEGKGCSAAQLLLAWVLKQRPFIVPIPGTKRSTHLQDNLRAALVGLSESELDQLNALIVNGAVIGERYSQDGMLLLNG